MSTIEAPNEIKTISLEILFETAKLLKTELSKFFNLGNNKIKDLFCVLKKSLFIIYIVVSLVIKLYRSFESDELKIPIKMFPTYGIDDFKFRYSDKSSL